MELIDFVKSLGYTDNQIDHAGIQLPGLFDEAAKRIKHNPFGLDNMYVNHTGDKNSVLVRFLVDLENIYIPTVHFTDSNRPDSDFIVAYLKGLERAVLFIDPISVEGYNLVTQINGSSALDKVSQEPINVRGIPFPRENMPLYLDNGAHNMQYVYPIFDWSDLQIWAAILHYDLDFQPHSEKTND